MHRKFSNMPEKTTVNMKEKLKIKRPTFYSVHFRNLRVLSRSIEIQMCFITERLQR